MSVVGVDKAARSLPFIMAMKVSDNCLFDVFLQEAGDRQGKADRQGRRVKWRQLLLMLLLLLYAAAGLQCSRV